MAYDASDKFTQPSDGIHLVGLAPTEAEIAEARGRISAGQPSGEVWADIDARIAARMQMRRDVGDTMPEPAE